MSTEPIVLTRHADVHSVLCDPRFEVPPLSAPTTTGGMEWLRATVSRFSTGATHLRRRALAVGLLAEMDPQTLERDAFDRTMATSAPLAEVARTVPVEVLAEALAAPDVTADDVTVVARAYHPGTGSGPTADAAVASLVRAFGGTGDEATAARIALLVQASAATAGLIVNAARTAQRCPAGTPIGALLAETLRHDPPVLITRRIAVAPALVGAVEFAVGTPVHLDLAAGREREPHLAFGAGPRRCPAGEHATRIAAGVLAARR